MNRRIGHRLAVGVIGLTAAAQAPVPAPTADDIPVYVIVIQDVLDAAIAPAAAHPPSFALDPSIYPRFLGHAPPIHDVTDSAGVVRLPDRMLRDVVLATGLRRLCEPVAGNACRGEVRGPVLRLGAVRRHTPDSAEVTVLATTARAERDNTAFAPLSRYYSYGLVRRNGRWRIVWAMRAALDPRAA